MQGLRMGAGIRRHPCYGSGRDGVGVVPSEIQELKLKGMPRVSAEVHSLAGDSLQQKNKRSCNMLALNALSLSETQRTRFCTSTCTLVHSFTRTTSYGARVTSACFRMYTLAFQAFIHFFHSNLPFKSSFDRENSQLTYVKKILNMKSRTLYGL